MDRGRHDELQNSFVSHFSQALRNLQHQYAAPAIDFEAGRVPNFVEAGFRVWFDRVNIDCGEDIVTAIELGLERSRVLVLCMTKAAFESEWVRLEWNTATFRVPANRDRRFSIPSVRR